MASKSKLVKLTIPLFAGEKVSRKTSLIGSVVIGDHVSGSDRILVVERPTGPSKAPRKRSSGKAISHSAVNTMEKPSPKSSGKVDAAHAAAARDPRQVTMADYSRDVESPRG